MHFRKVNRTDPPTHTPQKALKGQDFARQAEEGPEWGKEHKEKVSSQNAWAKTINN